MSGVFFLKMFRYSSVHQKRSEAEFSCVSMRSNRSMEHPIEFKSEDTKTDLRYAFMFSASKIKVFVHIILLYNYYVYVNTQINVYI